MAAVGQRTQAAVHQQTLAVVAAVALAPSEVPIAILCSVVLLLGLSAHRPPIPNGDGREGADI